MFVMQDGWFRSMRVKSVSTEAVLSSCKERDGEEVLTNDHELPQYQLPLSFLRFSDLHFLLAWEIIGLPFKYLVPKNYFPNCFIGQPRVAGTSGRREKIVTFEIFRKGSNRLH